MKSTKKVGAIGAIIIAKKQWYAMAEHPEEVLTAWPLISTSSLKNLIKFWRKRKSIDFLVQIDELAERYRLYHHV